MKNIRRILYASFCIVSSENLKSDGTQCSLQLRTRGLCIVLPLLFSQSKLFFEICRFGVILTKLYLHSRIHVRHSTEWQSVFLRVRLTSALLERYKAFYKIPSDSLEFRYLIVREEYNRKS